MPESPKMTAEMLAACAALHRAGRSDLAGQIEGGAATAPAICARFAAELRTRDRRIDQTQDETSALEALRRVRK